MHRSARSTLFGLVALALSLPAVQCSAPENIPDDTSKSGAPPAAAPIAVGPTASATAHAATRAQRTVAESAVRVPVEGLPSFGDYSAAVTVVAFTDYECPYCAKAEKTLAALREEFGKDLRVVVASKPLPIHDHAPSAARAFLAAQSLGKGEEMHAKLFAARDHLDDAAIQSATRSLGIDPAKFALALDGPTVAAGIARAEALATRLDVTGTPTFFVNGRRMLGARPLEEFRAVVNEELVKARALLAQGVDKWSIYSTILANAPEAPPPASQAALDEKPVDIRIDGAPLRGPARAPVTIAMFSDFECPFCVRLESTMKAVEAAYPGKVRVAFRHLPLPMHPHARIAAKASVAAENQGQFWAYHDVLVQHRDALDRESLRSYAREVGLDLSRFDRDLDDAKTEARVASDEAQAAALGVTGTPVAFVNGRRVSGAQPIATFRAVVDRALLSK